MPFDIFILPSLWCVNLGQEDFVYNSPEGCVHNCPEDCVYNFPEDCVYNCPEDCVYNNAYAGSVEWAV